MTYGPLLRPKRRRSLPSYWTLIVMRGRGLTGRLLSRKRLRRPQALRRVNSLYSARPSVAVWFHGDSHISGLKPGPCLQAAPTVSLSCPVVAIGFLGISTPTTVPLTSLSDIRR